MKTGRDYTILVVSLVVFCLLLGALQSYGEDFSYKYLGTVGWVPGDGYVTADSVGGWVDREILCLSLVEAFGRRPEMITTYSPSDWRWFMMSADYLANTELMSYSATPAILDSLLNFAHVVPSAGKVYYGYLPWIVAPASSDTIWIDGYMEKD